MKIFVDADACPKPIKEIIFRAAVRTKIHALLVANHHMEIPPSEFIKLQRVASGFDVADNEIIKLSSSGDLVVTADILLAAAVVKNGCLALNPRGTLYDSNTIQQRLSTRNLMEQLRETGVVTGGPSQLSKQDCKLFANKFDQILTRGC